MAVRSSAITSRHFSDGLAGAIAVSHIHADAYGPAIELLPVDMEENTKAYASASMPQLRSVPEEDWDHLPIVATYDANMESHRHKRVIPVASLQDVSYAYGLGHPATLEGYRKLRTPIDLNEKSESMNAGLMNSSASAQDARRQITENKAKSKYNKAKKKVSAVVKRKSNNAKAKPSAQPECSSGEPEDVHIDSEQVAIGAADGTDTASHCYASAMDHNDGRDTRVVHFNEEGTTRTFDNSYNSGLHGTRSDEYAHSYANAAPTCNLAQGETDSDEDEALHCTEGEQLKEKNPNDRSINGKVQTDSLANIALASKSDVFIFNVAPNYEVNKTFHIRKDSSQIAWNRTTNQLLGCLQINGLTVCSPSRKRLGWVPTFSSFQRTTSTGTCLEWVGCSSTMASGLVDGSISFVCVREGKLERVSEQLVNETGRNAPIRDIHSRLANDICSENELLVATDEGKAAVYDLRAPWKKCYSISSFSTSSVYSARWACHDSNIFACATYPGVWICDIRKDDKPILKHKTTFACRSLRWRPGYRYQLSTGSSVFSSTIQIWNLQNLIRPLYSLSSGISEIRAFDWLDREHLVTSDAAGYVCVHSVERATQPLRNTRTTSISWSPTMREFICTAGVGGYSTAEEGYIPESDTTLEFEKSKSTLSNTEAASVNVALQIPSILVPSKSHANINEWNTTATESYSIPYEGHVESYADSVEVPRVEMTVNYTPLPNMTHTPQVSGPLTALFPQVPSAAPISLPTNTASYSQIHHQSSAAYIPPFDTLTNKSIAQPLFSPVLDTNPPPVTSQHNIYNACAPLKMHIEEDFPVETIATRPTIKQPFDELPNKTSRSTQRWNRTNNNSGDASAQFRVFLRDICLKAPNSHPITPPIAARSSERPPKVVIFSVMRATDDPLTDATSIHLKEWLTITKKKRADAVYMLLSNNLLTDSSNEECSLKSLQVLAKLPIQPKNIFGTLKSFSLNFIRPFIIQCMIEHYDHHCSISKRFHKARMELCESFKTQTGGRFIAHPEMDPPNFSEYLQSLSDLEILDILNCFILDDTSSSSVTTSTKASTNGAAAPHFIITKMGGKAFTKYHIFQLFAFLNFAINDTRKYTMWEYLSALFDTNEESDSIGPHVSSNAGEHGASGWMPTTTGMDIRGDAQKFNGNALLSSVKKNGSIGSRRMERLRKALPSLLIQHFANANDVQMCLILATNLLDEASAKEREGDLLRWSHSYATLLKRLQMHNELLLFLNCSKFEKIRQMGRLNLAAIPEKSFNCDDLTDEKIVALRNPLYPNQISKCRVNKFKSQEKPLYCAVCGRIVWGLYVGCPECSHGGHPKHIRQWFKENGRSCPAGCGHHCSGVA